MPTLFGTDPNQVPTNADLGSLAFTDGKGAGVISAGTVDFIRANKITNASNIRPSLDLNFITKKLDPRITFTRASAATYVGADGLVKYAVADEPRFDHDPVTGECKGLLIEEQRTNLLPYTTTMTGGTWAFNSASISSTTATVSPDGTTNAIKLIEVAATAAHRIQCTANTSSYSGSKLTSSVYLKSAERRYATLSYGTNEYSFMTVDLQTGTIIGTKDDSGDSTTLDSWSMVNVGNGWYRCSVTVTEGTPTTSRGVFVVSMSDTADLPLQGYGKSYTGDGASGIYMWGPQCEVGAFATSYILNSTSTSLMRNFDLAYMSDLSWYNQIEGSLLFDALIPNWSKTTYVLYLTTVQGYGGTERIQIAIDATNKISCALVSNGVVTLSDLENTYVSPIYKSAFAMNFDSATAVRNSVDIFALPVNAAVPKPTYMYIGVAINTGAINGWLKRVTYYPKRLSDAELKELTK